MSRRYPVHEEYQERERDFYARGPRRTTREYEELDVDIRSRQPDFMREDYGRSSQAGELVVRDRREVDVERSSRRGSPPQSRRGSLPPGPRPRRREVEKEELIIRHEQDDSRSERPRRRERSVERDNISIRTGRSQPDLRQRPREVEKEEIDINIARTEREERPRPRPREVERDEITIRRSETEKPPPRPREVDREDLIFRRGEGERRPRMREVEKEEIIIRRDESIRGAPPPPPPPASTRGGRSVREEIDIDIRHDHDSRSVRGRDRSASRDRITIREQSRGPPPREQLVAREVEEFVVRRRRPPSPSPSPSPPRRKVETDTIVIKRTERSPTPPPPPAPRTPTPPPPPVLEPIYRPPIHQQIHQEIITHHRHIDHGVERARSPTPPPPPREPTPPPPPPEKVETLEIDIQRRGDGKNFKEEITIDRVESRGRKEKEVEVARPRSLSAPRRRYYDDDVEAEAEFYNRKALERSYPGEAYDGATKDWAIVDVPPGTERVKMHGAGGGSQEISWQRYNGVRRSKFITGDREFDSPYGAPAPPPVVEDRQVVIAPKRKPADMWTEVTKDLVLKEAIDEMGYAFEETEYFFYVMEYLRYEDVLQLVEISDEIRAARRRRIREIEWEREEISAPRRSDDRYYEHEVVIDRRRH